MIRTFRNLIGAGALALALILPQTFALAAWNESNASASVVNDARLAQLNNGYLRIYCGTQPTNSDTALSGNTLAAELRFSTTAFGASSNGSATANSITSATAAATCTATFARLLKSDGTTVVMDGTVGTSGADINLSTTSIVSGGSVSITSLTLSQTPH